MRAYNGVAGGGRVSLVIGRDEVAQCRGGGGGERKEGRGILAAGPCLHLLPRVRAARAGLGEAECGLIDIHRRGGGSPAGPARPERAGIAAKPIGRPGAGGQCGLGGEWSEGRCSAQVCLAGPTEWTRLAPSPASFCMRPIIRGLAGDAALLLVWTERGWWEHLALLPSPVSEALLLYCLVGTGRGHHSPFTPFTHPLSPSPSHTLISPPRPNAPVPCLLFMYSAQGLPGCWPLQGHPIYPSGRHPFFEFLAILPFLPSCLFADLPT